MKHGITPMRAMAVQAILFGVAVLVHSGLLLPKYGHARAAIAEGVILCVLALGMIAAKRWPERDRLVGTVVQAIALAGTLVGAFTIAIGIGPQTIADKLFHLVLLVILVGGLVMSWRSGNGR